MTMYERDVTQFVEKSKQTCKNQHQIQYKLNECYKNYQFFPRDINARIKNNIHLRF